MRRRMRSTFLLIVLLAFGLALFSACASMTGETAGENIDDNTITAEANAVIVKDPQAHYLKIDVETTQGNVVLTGFVNSEETADRLVKKIKEIRGVKSVKNLLKVEEKE
ncbi:MAG: BON domain-containing protein [Candidatus Sulfobium sp.]